SFSISVSSCPFPARSSGRLAMTKQFEYGVARIKDLQVNTSADRAGKNAISEVLLDGRPVRPSQRFWTSLHLRFGFTSTIFRYFSHKEVFDRISEVAPNDRLRWCLEVDADGAGRLLAVTNPAAGLIRHNDLLALLDKHQAQDVRYADGVV